jgi:hypothetical protein
VVSAGGDAFAACALGSATLPLPWVPGIVSIPTATNAPSKPPTAALVATITGRNGKRCAEGISASSLKPPRNGGIHQCNAVLPASFPPELVMSPT